MDPATPVEAPNQSLGGTGEPVDVPTAGPSAASPSTIDVQTTAVQHQFADAAKDFQWNCVNKMLAHAPSLVNSQAPGGGGMRWPVLHQAIFSGCLAQVVYLVQKGADINLKNRDGKDAIAMAMDQLKETSQSAPIEVADDKYTQSFEIANEILNTLRLTKKRQELGMPQLRHPDPEGERNRPPAAKACPPDALLPEDDSDSQRCPDCGPVGGEK